ncbi:hypothetical protein [Nocardia bovistercoris]|uniref:WXG100 family type VII secretion target n=1 Tax=Nocardia bovistercoris TaxID=2785916 RepID=A0A931IFI1_9NOCA|nr:hypothetical protein [Nocardia bovistercoris]MBH0778840.1 hypothetical protein [Nocardia bovistercoris]
MGDTWIIDSGMYFDASNKCRQLATDISLALGPLQRALVNDCGGMAGDHEKSQPWTTSYDQHARDIVTLAAALCNALQRFGDVLAANGYNWWHSDRTHATGAEPARPKTSEPLYDSGMALPASASGNNGEGIDTSIAGLMEQVGRIPNGDVTKLGIAKDAWKTFADNATITGAADRINGVNVKFSDSSDPNIADIEQKLGTLKNAAKLLSQAATGLAGPVKDHHDALETMRNDVEAAVANAAKEIAGAIVITVAVVGVVAFFTAGMAAPAAAAGGGLVTAEIVSTTATLIRTTVTASRVLALFGAVVVAGSAGGVFTAIPDLTQNGINAAIAGIAAMAVKIVDDDEESAGPANSSNTPGTSDYGRRVQELAADPAKNGKVSPQSEREAEVGLALENAGRVGPLERAPLGANGEDQGEFIDTKTGQRWDVKSSPDVIPDYRPASVAGQPIQNPQSEQDFIDMIEDSLADGESVMIDQSGMTPARIAQLKQVVANNPQWQGKVLW